MDCPTITVPTGKCYKALIDSEATISLLRYSTYQSIKDSFKTPLQPTTAKLNTANGSPVTALGMTALHLWIAEFQFTHTFVICDRLPDTEIIFGIDFQKKFLLSYTCDKEKNCLLDESGTAENKEELLFSHDKLSLASILRPLHQVTEEMLV